MKNLRLSIQEIADLKEGRKSLKEITKTHDGTSMGQGFMKHALPFIKRHATSNVSRALIFEIDKKMGVVGIDEDEISWNIEHSRSGGKDLNLIRNVGAKTEYDWHVDDSKNGLPFSVPTKEDMNLITEKNDYGEYAYRSMTLVSPGLKSMTLIRNNKFSPEDEKQYRKTVNKLYKEKEEFSKNFSKELQQNHQRNPELDIQENNKEVIEIMRDKYGYGTMYEFLSKNGYVEEFSKCNVRLDLRDNEGKLD